MNALTPFEAQAAAIAVTKLLYGGSFYITDFDAIAKKIGTEIDAKERATLHLLHCVSWSDMDPAFREQVRLKVVELLGLPPSIIEGESRREEERKPEPKPRRAKLLGLIKGALR